jgi:phage terminase large subunit-like protein
MPRAIVPKKPRATKTPKALRPVPDTPFQEQTVFLSDDPVIRNAQPSPEARVERSREEKLARLALLQEQRNRVKRQKFLTYYPDTGPLRRELYVKHMKFFAAGAKYRQRLMLAANRIGKTEGVGLYELTLHLTGRYPDWWVGRRFTRPIKAWACAVTQQKVREILQDKLLGPVGHWGEGMLPHDSIVKVTAGGGVADSVSTVYVASRWGGVSQVEFKSYEQGRKGFEGTEQDVILEDEEPPLSIHTECLIRTMTNDGIMMLTFTPLQGMSEVVLDFLPGGRLKDDAAVEDPLAPASSKYVIMATWDDAPHLSDAVKKELWESIPPFQRDARSKGIPQLGSGAIYPVLESEIVVPDFAIPDYWPRAFALDVGWNRTAAIWGAWDLETGTLYLYSEYYRSQAEPIIHVQGIRARGSWINGVIDPASRGRSQADGTQLLSLYEDLGLVLQPADNGVESGIYKVWQGLSTGKIKVFGSLQNWLAEFRMYRRDDKGKVVKDFDHLMDTTRYLVASGREVARAGHLKQVAKNPEYVTYSFSTTGWMNG